MMILAAYQKFGLSTVKHLCAALVCLALLTLMPGQAFAGVYKFIDKNGKIHYGDQPFSYRQDNFREGRNDEHYRQKKINATYFHGLWNLEGHSRHLGNEISPDRAKWLFKADGSMKVQKADDSINNSRFRFQGKLIEIVEDQAWSIYHLITLTKKRLIIYRKGSGKYLYFNKRDDAPAQKDTARPSTSLLYSREQIARLIVLFSCTGVIYSELSTAEKSSLEQEIFMETGISQFNDKKFSESMSQFKTDPIFAETYLPRIASGAKNCAGKARLPSLPTIQF